MKSQIYTSRSWDQILRDVKDELRKWGILQVELPYKGDSERFGSVTVRFARNGDWKTLKCDRWGNEHKGPERNLLAILIALQGFRKAEQRGIGQLMIDLARMALPSGQRTPQDVLGVYPGIDDPAVLTAAYKSRAKRVHPDVAGPTARVEWDALQEAARKLGLIDEKGQLINDR